MGRKNQFLLLALAIPSIFLGIRADVSAAPHSAAEWAGVYTHRVDTSTMVYRLIITRDSRFKLILGGCFGNSEVDHGTVAWRDGELILRPSAPVEFGFPRESERMVPVRSGTRLYLFADDPLMQFERDAA